MLLLNRITQETEGDNRTRPNQGYIFGIESANTHKVNMKTAHSSGSKTSRTWRQSPKANGQAEKVPNFESEDKPKNYSSCGINGQLSITNDRRTEQLQQSCRELSAVRVHRTRPERAYCTMNNFVNHMISCC